MRRGFSLIELLVVIGLCSALSLLTIPSLKLFRDKLYLKGSAGLAASVLRRAQSEAMSRNKSAICDTAGFYLPPGITLSGKKAFSFAATGGAALGGTGTLVITDKSGGRKKIIISAIGRVRLE